jgi:ATP-dependent RNA helicase DeaD
MKGFKQGRVSVILATDVAARGIDVDDLTHVIHYNLSDDNAFYTHRAGRTARAGKTGISLVFATSRDRRKVREIEKMLKITFEQWTVPDVDQIFKTRLSDWASRISHTEVDPKAHKLFKEAMDILRDQPMELIVPQMLQAELARMGYYEARKNEDQRKVDKRSRKDESRSRKGDSRSRKDEDRRDNRKSASPERGNRKKRREEEFSGRSRDFEERPSGQMHRYYINIGSVDGVSKPDLIEFIAEQGNIPKKAIGQVIIHKKNAYFEVSADKGKGLGSRFEGISVNNRSLRVNRDDVKNENPKKGKKKKK